MGKGRRLNEIVNILVKALRHRIGSIVNPDELYSKKYAKDADVLMKEAEKIILKENLNDDNKERIRKNLREGLRIELEKKRFLRDKKFKIMDEEIEKALVSLGINK